jgi:hypothetical protein
MNQIGSIFMSNDRISKAVQIVKNYSLFTEEDEQAKSSLKSALTKFFDTINSDEKEECFKTIVKYGNVPSYELENLRAKLNGLFDKQQDLAVNNPAITPKESSEVKLSNVNKTLEQAKNIINDYSHEYTKGYHHKVEETLKSFIIAQTPVEKDLHFNIMVQQLKLDNNFSEALCTELNNLFDKQQDLAVNNPAITPKESSEVKLNNVNKTLEQAKNIINDYSHEYTKGYHHKVEETLKSFIIAQTPVEKDLHFSIMVQQLKLDNNFSEALRTELNNLFDKQQDLAVNNPAITEPSRNDTQYAGTDIKSPISRTVLNNDKIDQSNKPNVSQIDPFIVNIDNQKYAVCVKDDNKYLVLLENQTTNAMVLAYNQANGITGIFNNSDMYDIKQISVNGESKEIFLGSFTTGTSSSAHSVEVVIYKDTDGQYKTTVLDQTSFKNNSDAKPEYQKKYKGFIKDIHSAIKEQHQNIKIDEQNIDFRHGVYQVEGNLAGCLDGLMFFADDLIKENFDVHKALTHAAEEIPLSRMASSRFNATCAVMEQNEQKVGLEQIPLGDINKKLDLKEFFTNSSDVETIKKIRDGSYSKAELAKIFVDDFGVQVKYLNEKVKQSLKESLNKFNDIPEIKLLTSGNFDNKALAKIITNNFTHEELADTFITKCRSEELFPKIITDNFTDEELSAIKNGDKNQGITIIIKKFDINQLAEIFIDNYNEEVLSRTRSGKGKMEDIFRNNIPREQHSLYTKELELLSNNITNQEAKETVLTKQLYKTKLKTTLESKFQKTELQKILEQSYGKEELETMLKKAFVENKPSIKAVVDDIGFLRKLTDDELQSLKGKEVQGKITQLLKQEVIQLQTAKQQDVTLDNPPIAPLKPTIVQSVTPIIEPQNQLIPPLKPTVV